MSYILDALRRAETERERERGAAPGLHAQPRRVIDPAEDEVPVLPPMHAGRLLSLGVAAAAVIAGLTWWLWPVADEPPMATLPPPASSAVVPASPQVPPGAMTTPGPLNAPDRGASPVPVPTAAVPPPAAAVPPPVLAQAQAQAQPRAMTQPAPEAALVEPRTPGFVPPGDPAMPLRRMGADGLPLMPQPGAAAPSLPAPTAPAAAAPQRAPATPARPTPAPAPMRGAVQGPDAAVAQNRSAAAPAGVQPATSATVRSPSAADSGPARASTSAAPRVTSATSATAATAATPAPTATPAPAATTTTLATTGSTPVLPRLRELAPDLRRELPPLAVSGSVYSPDAPSRMLVLDGQVLREGQNAAPGVLVEQIGPKAAVLSFKGQRFELPYGP